jgi:alpha-1,3-glucan synthase
VLSGKDYFALSNVEDLFTDSDGKYFKQFSTGLHKMDPKTSKDELCIGEFINRSEKEWSTAMRNKKLGIESSFGSDMRGYFSKKVTAPTGEDSEGIPPEAPNVEKPILGYTSPTGMKLFLQRRIGDWPLYSFLLALVFSHRTLNIRDKSLQPAPSSSVF